MNSVGRDILSRHPQMMTRLFRQAPAMVLISIMVVVSMLLLPSVHASVHITEDRCRFIREATPSVCRSCFLHARVRLIHLRFCVHGNVIIDTRPTARSMHPLPLYCAQSVQVELRAAPRVVVHRSAHHITSMGMSVSVSVSAACMSRSLMPLQHSSCVSMLPS